MSPALWPAARAARGSRSSTASPGSSWAPGGKTRGVVEFTIHDDRIVAIRVTGDAQRLAEIDLVLLDE